MLIFFWKYFWKSSSKGRTSSRPICNHSKKCANIDETFLRIRSSIYKIMHYVTTNLKYDTYINEETNLHENPDS